MFQCMTLGIEVNLAECMQRQVNHFKQHNRHEHFNYSSVSPVKYCFKQTRFNRTLAL